MKKTLALMALCAALAGVTQQAQALSITDNSYTVDHEMDLTAEGDTLSVELTGGGTATFTKATGVLSDFASSQAISLTFSSKEWSAGDYIIYNDADSTTGAPTGQTCGFIADADGVLRGAWGTGGKWSSGTATNDDITIAKSNITDTVKVVLSKTEGTSMYNNAGTSLYSASDLKSSNSDENLVYINQEYVSSITLHEVIAETEYYINNSSGTTIATLQVADTYLLSGTGKHGISSASTAVLGKSNIVVDGASQMFVNSHNNGQDLTIDSDIYIGTTTYNEANYEGVSIRFGNNGTYTTGTVEEGNQERHNITTTLNGDIYLIDSTKIKATNDLPVVINGDITDTVNGTKTNSNLSIIGRGITVNGAVSLNELTIDNRGYTTTFTSDVNVSALAINSGTTVTVTGTTTEGETTTSKLSAGSIEFGAGATLNVTGSLTLDANSISIISGTTFSSATEQTLVSVTDGTLTVNNVGAWTGSTYTIDGTKYTTTLSATDSLLKLEFTAISMDLVVGSAELAGDVLTLNVDADLTNIVEVDLTLSEDALADIAGLSGQVGITVAGLNGTEIVGNGVNNVTFYNGAYAGEGAGKYQIAYIPEPTTATLSLLALAGLAARRRRK